MSFAYFGMPFASQAGAIMAWDGVKFSEGFTFPGNYFFTGIGLNGDIGTTTPATGFFNTVEISPNGFLVLFDGTNIALGSSNGTRIGVTTTQKFGFWGATPIIQPSGATQAAPAAYATGVFGLDSNAHMQALYDLVVAMRTALVDTGIMKGSA